MKMTRLAAVSVLLALVMVLGFARPVAASNRYWATGTGQYYLPLLGFCAGTNTYPANQPLIIAHGWGDNPFITDPTKGAFMNPTTHFELQIDGVTQRSVPTMHYFPDIDTMFKFYISEYDEGWTGTHDFLGLWYLDGVLVGGTPHEPVLVGTCPVTITFT